MKVKLTYIPEEQDAAAAVMAALLRLLPGVRVHKNESKPPFLHIYLTAKTRKPLKFQVEHLTDTPVHGIIN